MGRAGEESYLMKVCIKHGISLSTLHRWMGMVRSLPRSEWEFVLRVRYGARGDRIYSYADISPDAWEYFLDQIRHGKSCKAAHFACTARAKDKGWMVPSESTLRRRLAREDLSLLRRRAFVEFDI